MKVYKEIELTQEELNLVIERLNHPLVISYFKGVAQSAVQQFLSANGLLMSNTLDTNAYATKGAFIQGAFSVVEEVLDLIPE